MESSLLAAGLIKLVLTTVLGPGNDAQHSQGGIYVRGNMGASLRTRMQGWVRCGWGARDLARLITMRPGLVVRWMMGLHIELLG